LELLEVRFALRFAVWLLLSVFAFSLSSCAELALPREQLYPQLAASSINPGEGVIVNIAPTPSPAPSCQPKHLMCVLLRSFHLPSSPLNAQIDATKLLDNTWARKRPAR
jgi:hypothetical protein